MRIQMRSRNSRAKTRDSSDISRVKVMMTGLHDIPAELDLPAGAPFVWKDQPATMHAPKDIQELIGPLVEIATNAWQLKIKMVDPDSGEPNEGTRKLYRFVERLFRALDNAGIQVIDKTGKPHDDGMSEKATYEETPGLHHKEIIETVRPTIRWKEKLYLGEIIVGIPVSKEQIDTSNTDTISATPETSPEIAQVTGATDASDPVERDSIDKTMLDTETSSEQGIGTHSNSDPDQTEVANSGTRSGQESQNDVQEDELRQMKPENTQAQIHSDSPNTPEQSNPTDKDNENKS